LPPGDLANLPAAGRGREDDPLSGRSGTLCRREWDPQDQRVGLSEAESRKRRHRASNSRSLLGLGSGGAAAWKPAGPNIAVSAPAGSRSGSLEPEWGSRAGALVIALAQPRKGPGSFPLDARKALRQRHRRRAAAQRLDHARQRGQALLRPRRLDRAQRSGPILLGSPATRQR